MYNPTGWVSALSGFRETMRSRTAGWEKYSRRRLWLLVHMAERARPGPCCWYQHDFASLADSTDHRQQSYPRIPAIQEQVRHSEKELLLRYREESQHSRLRKSCIHNSNIEFRWPCPMTQHSALHPTAQSLKVSYIVPLGRLPDILYYLHFAHCYFYSSWRKRTSTFTNLFQKSVGTNSHLGQELMSCSAIS